MSETSRQRRIEQGAQDRRRFADLVQRLQGQRQLTQQQLARAIGLTSPALAAWTVKAGTDLDPRLLPPLARALGAPPEVLLDTVGYLTPALARPTALLDGAFQLTATQQDLLRVAARVEGVGGPWAGLSKLVARIAQVENGRWQSTVWIRRRGRSDLRVAYEAYVTVLLQEGEARLRHVPARRTSSTSICVMYGLPAAPSGRSNSTCRRCARCSCRQRRRSVPLTALAPTWCS